MRVLLTGGAGFIGSHIADCLLARGHEVAIVDNLSTGKRENVPEGTRFYEVDIRSGCAEVFQEFQPQALCHQAAQMDVRRSVREPDFDADVNVLGTIRLLQNCVPYGVSKLAGERYLHFYGVQYGISYSALRYANVYGPRQDPHGEAGVVAIFSNRILDGSALTVFGDGRQTRDYVYVGDV